jgi:hypothetical protein
MWKQHKRKRKTQKKKITSNDWNVIKMTGWFGSEPSTERYTIPIGCCIYYHHYYYYLLCLAATLSLSLASSPLTSSTHPSLSSMYGGRERAAQRSIQFDAKYFTLLFDSQPK